MYKKNKKIFCCNCGKQGHIYKKCKEPITSFGVIAFKFDEGFEDILINLLKHNKNKDHRNTVVLDAIEKNIKFLLIRRKDTLGYVEFIRGRYSFNKVSMLMRLFNIMTIHELDKIRNNDFDYLWNDLWLLDKGLKTDNNLYIKEYEISKQRYNNLKKGVTNSDNELIKLDNLLKKSNCKYTEQEWGLPKGRKNIRENYKQCAIREFEEETGINSEDYKLISMKKPLEELFMGTNNLWYKHIYYIAQCNPKCNLVFDDNNISQVIEISDIRWFSYKDALEIIRPYNKEKKIMIRNALKIIKQHIIFKYL